MSNLSSRKQLMSQIDLILEDEVHEKAPILPKEDKPKGSNLKISEPALSSRKQLSSLKNVNAYV